MRAATRRRRCRSNRGVRPVSNGVPARWGMGGGGGPPLPQGKPDHMPAKPLTELPSTILHAARRACLTLLIDQHRVYLDPPLPMLLSKLRDDAGDAMNMESLGRPKPLGVRKISEATDSELSAMTDAVDSLLGTRR